MKWPFPLPSERLVLSVLLGGLAFSAAFGQMDEREKNPLPRGLTPEERELLPTYVPPWRGPATPPPGAVRAMAEFEELEGIVVRWAYGTSNLLLSQIVDAAQDEGTVWILVRPGTSDTTNIKTYLSARGIPLTNIQFLSTSTNSIWCRDYGPWTVYDTETDSMALVDFRYNRPRPLDDVVPSFLAGEWGLPLYQTTAMPDSLVFTGGNFMVDGFGTGFASRLVNDENTHLTDPDIDSILWRYCGLRRFVKMETLLHDAIHHIDMHMKLLDEETLLIGEYPPGRGDHDRIENTVAYLQTLENCYGRPYRIVRIPMPPDLSGNYPPASSYFTYTNSLIVNRTVLVPVYGFTLDATALQVYRDAMPGYRVLGFDCNAIIPSSGAIHCITKEVGVREPVLIAHRRLSDFPDTVASYRIEAEIATHADVDSVLLCWRPDTSQAFRRVPLTDSSGIYVGGIPGQPPGATIGYYLCVKTVSGRTVSKPPVGPDGPFTFAVQPTSAVVSVTIPIRDDWNLLSCPVRTGNDSVSSLFPTAITPAYGYAAGTGYQAQARMAGGVGYWVKFNGVQSATIADTARHADSVEVMPGWNLVGSISDSLAASGVSSIPGGIRSSDFFGYDGTYAVADTLVPGRGYWVRVSQPGRLVLSVYPFAGR